MAKKLQYEKPQEQDKAGWWNDFYKTVTYVQNEKGQWHAASRRWPPA